MKPVVRPFSADLPFVLAVVAGTTLRLAHPGSGPPQYLLRLVVASAAYVVMVRWGAWRWLAAAAVVPALLDGQAMDVEGAVLFLVLAGLLVIACWRCPGRDLSLAVSAVWVVVLATAHVSGHDPRLSAPDRLASSVALAGLVLALAAVTGLGRAEHSPLRRPTLLLAGLPLLFLASVSGSDLASRLGSPAAIQWWPVAGAVGLTALLRGRRGRAASRPQSDEVDSAALSAFREQYGAPRLAPVVVVIAAYDEAGGIGGVLSALPREVCGLPCDVLVVDDGSTDDTADAVAPTRAYAVRCPVNRGQGAALRLGYRLAREHGALYILTTDADGQYDVGDLPAVLSPILEDRADFVTGSRVLGHQHTHDRVRRTGVHVFAWVATVLTGRRLTDTSFGLRAMRAAVPAVVTLNQTQYQSSELLIGAISHGFRVVEVPATMHVRGAGSSKKGRNLAYGTRYARAVLGTWWREGCPRPVTDAAALREWPEQRVTEPC